MATDPRGRKPGRSSGRSTSRSKRDLDEDDEVIDAEIDEGKGEASERPKAIPDLFRRAMATGLSGFFTTEEAFRRALGETLPQDWIDFVGEQSERTRAELIDRMSNELGRVIQQIDIGELLAALLEGQTLEVDARIRLVSDADDDGAANRRKSSSDRIRFRLANDGDPDEEPGSR